MCIPFICISKREETKMPNPQFIEEKGLSLVEVKTAIDKIEKRDATLNYLSGKSKDYLDSFVTLSAAKKAELHKKLTALELTRLKEEHIAKITDFLPKTVNELKIVLLAYPLSLPKKDQDSIVAAVQEIAE